MTITTTELAQYEAFQKAAKKIERMYLDEIPAPSQVNLHMALSELIAAARRSGAEAMRERCKAKMKELGDTARLMVFTQENGPQNYVVYVLGALSAAIDALPLDPATDA